MIQWTRLFIFTVAWLLALLTSFGDVAKGQTRPVVVLQTMFSGITLAQNSAPLTNTGIIQHTIKVEFPTAKATVTPLSVFLQGSYDNNAWFPMSLAVTSVTSLTGAPSFYAFVTAYGAFPYVRVVSSLNTPGGLPMTVRYVGYSIPNPNFATLLADRFVF